MGIPRQTTKIVHLAIYKGRSEFYSGVRHGSLVWLTEDIALYDSANGPYGHDRNACVYLSVQGIYQDTAHLAVYNTDDVEVIA